MLPNYLHVLMNKSVEILSKWFRFIFGALSKDDGSLVSIVRGIPL